MLGDVDQAKIIIIKACHQSAKRGNHGGKLRPRQTWRQTLPSNVITHNANSWQHHLQNRQYKGGQQGKITQFCD